MDVSTFLVSFPEFSQTETRFIAAAITRAARWVSPDVWGDMTDDGIALYAAHLLASAPFGSNTRLQPGETTTYEVEFEKLKLAVVGGGFTVSGGGCMPGTLDRWRGPY